MNREPINSSNIKSIGYEDGTLEIEFSQGLVYQYYGVPEELYESIFKAESIGVFVTKFIKPDFPYKLIGFDKDIPISYTRD